MTGTAAGARPLIISCALALAELHFPQRDGAASPGHAHLLLTGRIDAWPGYWDLYNDDRQRLAGLLSHRGDDLASEEGFSRALRSCADAGDLDGYRLGDDGMIQPIHGMQPAAYADRLLASLDQLRQRAARRRSAARPGRHRSVLRGLSADSEQTTTRAIYNLSDLTPPPLATLTLADATRLDQAEFGIDALRKMAERIDTARGQQHRRQRIEAIFGTLLDSDGNRVTDALRIRAGGPVQVLQAPTAAGKTVTLEVLGTLCAETSVPIAIVVPTRASALSLAREIETNLNLLSIAATSTPLLAPRRNMKDAEAAAKADPGGLGQWVYQRLGYGCALSAAAEVDDTVDAWDPGEEPCHELYEIRADGQRGSARACPWQGTCGKFQLERAAVTADVIVTAHHTFHSGTMRLPFSTSAGTSDRVTVEEFLFRRCQVVVIDELDQFQGTVIDRSARHLVLADGPRDTTLRDLDTEFHSAFGQVQPEVDGIVRPILSDLRLLAEGYVANLAHGWVPPVRDFRRGWRTDHWIVARGNDAWITAALLGRAGGREVTADEVEAMRHLYRTPYARPAEPLRLQGIGGQPGSAGYEQAQAAAQAEIGQVLAAVTDGCRDAILPVYKAQLSKLLSPVVADDRERGRLVDRMLRRCYLEPLRGRLSELFFHTSHLRAAGAESAEAIADALGGFSRWAAMPASPLGRLFLAFRERLDPERPDQARLSVAAFGGDPHGYTLFLGELTARAHARAPRAVLGLSATPYLPGAPHHHVHARPAWIIPDTDPRGVTIRSAQVFSSEQQAIRVSGVQGSQRDKNISGLAEALYKTKLTGDLAALERDRRQSGRPGRDRILIATTSYDSVLLLAEGFKRAGAPDGEMCVLARPSAITVAKDPRWLVLGSDRVEQFPATGARILIAPLGVVERGVNVLDGGVSALGLIYLVIRPVPILDEPAELLAHVSHRLWAEAAAVDLAAGDPLDNIRDRVAGAGRLFDEIVCSAQFFRSLPGWVQEGIVAEIIIGLIQLVGRARRGGTPGEIRLVDDAFFDERGNSHLPVLIKRLQQRWETAGELGQLLELYGPTLQAFFEFADRHLNAAVAPLPGEHTC
jgi:hypothetical protein